MSNGHRRSLWRRLVAEIDGGDSPCDVARRHGVNYRTLLWRRWQSRSGLTERASQATFLPVVVRQEPETTCPVLEVVVRDIVVRVTPGSDPTCVAPLAGDPRQC